MITSGSVLFLLCSLFIVEVIGGKVAVDPKKCKVWGPGLNPDKIVLPARYFFVEAFDKHAKR